MASQAGWDPRGEPDLSPADERWLGEWALREHGSEFLFVPGFPMRKRPFYTQHDPSRPGFSRSFDLLFRGLELVTGGQRLHNYSDYIKARAAPRRGHRPVRQLPAGVQPRHAAARRVRDRARALDRAADRRGQCQAGHRVPKGHPPARALTGAAR